MGGAYSRIDIVLQGQGDDAGYRILRLFRQCLGIGDRFRLYVGFTGRLEYPGCREYQKEQYFLQPHLSVLFSVNEIAIFSHGYQASMILT